MTREESQTAEEVMLAYADGKEIEFKYKSEKDWESSKDYLKIDFDFIMSDYRIKPEPTYSPFKDKEECWAEMQKHQPLGWVRDRSFFTMLNNVDEASVSYMWGNNLREISYCYAFEHITFADGTPFGIKEE